MFDKSRFWIVAALSLAACGGGEKGAAGTTTGAAPAAGTSTGAAAAPAPAPGAPGAAPSTAGTATAKPITGTTHDIKMVGDATGYKYVPATITIKAGDGLKFTVVSGPPHNVTFWPDSIPAGAQAQLAANMPNTTAPMTGPLLMNPNESYTVSFAGVPAGTYKGYCTPHLAMGMRLAVTVQ